MDHGDISYQVAPEDEDESAGYIKHSRTLGNALKTVSTNKTENLIISILRSMKLNSTGDGLMNYSSVVYSEKICPV